MSIEENETAANPNADTAENIAPAPAPEPVETQEPAAAPTPTPEPVDVRKGGFH